MEEGLPTRLREARRAAGLLQRELGERCGISGETVRKWEAGIRSPRLNHLRAVADALGCDVEWLLTGRDEEYRGLLTQLRELLAEGGSRGPNTQPRWPDLDETLPAGFGVERDALP